jgi:1-acyl-sn-glycerol-3-phosphate acyltransferase
MMKQLLKPLQWLYCLYAFAVFILTLMLVFPFALLASLFGIIQGGNMIYRLCSIWGDVWFFLIGISHRNIYETLHDRKKQYVFVANHSSYLDAPSLVKTIRQPIRALGKIEMKNIPLFGFIYAYAVVVVDRSSAANRAKSLRNLKSVLSKGISIIVFPEGTFNMTPDPLKTFYDGAFRIAIETQTPIKPVLFVDALRRMHHRSVFTLNPGINRSVFLEEIPVAGLTMEDLPGLKQRVFEVMWKKLREYRDE